MLRDLSKVKSAREKVPSAHGCHRDVTGVWFNPSADAQSLTKCPQLTFTCARIVFLPEGRRIKAQL
jgi:hypothetical protein